MWGRRVVLYYVYVLVFLCILALLKSAFAADISVSATVTPSSLYITHVQNASKLAVSYRNKVAYISGTVSDGLRAIPHASFDLLIVSDRDVVEVRHTGTLSNEGRLQYVFIPVEGISYRLFLLDTTYKVPYLISVANLGI